MNPFGKYPGIRLNNRFYSTRELTEADFNKTALAPIELEALNFARSLFSKSETIEVRTSGSTGKPKTLTVPKSAMEISAKATNSFFGLTAKSTAALALPLEYIAGKMMVARAIVGQYELFVLKPKSTAIPNFRVDFMPLTPMQMDSSFREKPDCIAHVKTYLIGGGKVEKRLHEKICSARINAWYSFGMTETLSHFALAKAGEGKTPEYRLLPGVEIGIDEAGKLHVNWLGITDGWMRTNDLATLTPNGFKWLGRADNLINSGGVKIIPEEVESLLDAFIQSPFFIAGIRDEKLGEAVTLFIEGQENIDLESVEWSDLYQKPRKTIQIEKFERTLSGKIKRNATVEKWSSDKDQDRGCG